MEGSRVFHVIVSQNEKIVDVNVTAGQNLKSYDISEFSKYMQECFKIEMDNTGNKKKITASEGALNYLDKLLKLQVDKLQNDNMQDLQVTTEILRSLRNCTSDLLTQQYIIADTNILDTTGAIFSIVITIDENNLCLKILLQFLINLMSSNKAVGEKIFVMYYERAKKCLQRKVHVYESAALIYNISLIKPIPDTELMNTVLDLYCEGFENEFLIFFLENSMLDSNFWNTYIHFKTEYKVIILKTLRNMELQRRTYSIPSVALEILIEQFLKFCDNIFHILENDECSIKAYEVLLLLEVLSSLSSDENYLKEFQSNKNVLINAGALLINIHMLGKQNNNCFTPIQKFKINHGLKEHPAFGFKADLIRLIGNICWKHKTMQDLARDAELIPIILDCCNMDARNPFIIQWSILAIRNLCENSKENQRIINELHQQGVVNADLISELGITVHKVGRTS